MLLTNWLASMTSRVRKRPIFRARDRRAIRRRWQTALSNQIATTEALEDRTLLTTFFVDDDFTGATPGFGSTSFASIQDAVDAAKLSVDPTDTINVAAGTYAEDVIVDTSVILQGANAGIAGNGVRGAESLIDPSSPFGIEVRADDVTIDGFEITGLNRDGINVRPTNSGPGVSTRQNIVIQNNYIHEILVPGNQVNGIVFGEKVGGGPDSTDMATISFVTIADNLIDVTDDNTARGILMTGHFASIHFDNFDITGNVIQAKNNGVFFSENPAIYTATGIEILDNTFESPGSTGINAGNLDSTSKVNGNTFINNASGAALNFAEPGGEVLNNTFENNTNVGLYFFDDTYFPQSSENPTVTGNTFINNGRQVGSAAPAVDLDAIQNNNSYDGGVKVSSNGNLYGSIQEAIDNALPGDDVTVVINATYTENVDVNQAVTLMGEATVDGSVTASVAGATIAPGFSPGIFTSTDLILTAGSSLNVEIDGNSGVGVTGGHDQYVTTGNVNLGGATLDPTGSDIVGATFGDTFKIIDVGGTLTGTFAGLANGDSVLVNGQTFRIFYNGGDGNDVVLSFLPPVPVTYVDTTFTGVNGTFITDADPNQAGDQNAVIGVNAFDTIQEGIDGVDAAGTVIVNAGTYNENITLSKQVDLMGAQAGVDARGRGGTLDDSLASIIAPAAGTGLNLQNGSAGATIDGFTFSGGTTGIVSTSGTIDDLQILNNQFVGFTGSGVFLNNSGDDITVHQNVIDGTSQVSSGGIFHLDQDTFDGFHFTSNWVLNGATGFFVDGTRNVSSSASRDPLFEDNLFDGNGAGANFGRFGVENAVVQNNVFSNNLFDGLQGGIQNSLITMNTFDTNNRAGLRLTGFTGTGDPTRGAQGNSIEENIFLNNGGGMSAAGYGDVRLDDQFDGTISTNTFFNNSFGSTVAVFNNETSGEVVDFSGNWWGTNDENAVSLKQDGAGALAVDFTPFLDNGTDTDLGTAGFQGDFSVLNVTALGEQTGAVGRIQEAVDSVTAGGTINILTGTFADNVTVDKAVTLKGAGTASTIVDNTGTIFTVTANDVKFQDMTIQNGSQGIRVDLFATSGTADNLQVDNVHFMNLGSRGIEIHNNTTVTNMSVKNSLFDNTGTGIRLASSAVGDGIAIDNTTFDTNSLAFYQANDGSTGNVRDLQITNSTFRNSTDTAVYAEELRDSSIDGNTFEDNRRDFTLFKEYTGAGTDVENLQIINNTMTDTVDSSVLIWIRNSALAGAIDINGNTINSDVGVMTVNWAKIDVRLDSSFTHAPVNINDNSITFSGTYGAGATAVYGIKVRGASDHINIERNLLDGGSVGSSGGTPETSGIYVQTDDGSMGAISATAEINVRNNTITGFDKAVSVYDAVGAAYGNLTAGAQLNINNNSITGNTLGIASGAGATVNASDNWWGSVVEATVAGLMPSVSAVDFTSYLNSGADTDGGTAGFQGDFSSLTVTDEGAQTGPAGRIAEALQAVTPGGTVKISSGTYTETVDATATGINKNVTLAPGNSPGQAILNGDLILNSDDQLDIEINGATPGSGFDQFVVNGDVTLNDAQLNLIDGYDPVDGDVFPLIQNDGANPVTGTFLGLPEGYEFVDFLGVVGQNAYLTYVGGNGNDVVIHVEDSTPEVNLPVNGTTDHYLLEIDGTNVVIKDFNTGDVISSAPLASLQGTLVINGEDGQSDTLSVDMTGINDTTPLQIQFNGGTGGNDTLELLGGSVNSVEHIFTSNSSGSVQLNGSGVDFISYTGLEPVLDTILAGTRTFSFTGAAETITLSDDVDFPGGPVAGQSQIDSDLFGEIVTFLDPTTNLIINTEVSGGSGADNVHIEGLDANFDANLTVNAGTDDTVTFQTNATDAGAGNVDITAGSIVLNAAVTTSTGNVSLNATNGSISGTSLVTADLLTLQATGNAGGSGTELNLAVASLEADVDGDLYAIDAGGLQVGAAGGLDGVTTGGVANIATFGGLTVTEDVVAGDSITLTAFDSAGTGDDLTINAGKKVQSLGGSVLLNAGDNLNVNSTASVISDAAAILLNIDSGNADVGTGGVANLNGTLQAVTNIDVSGFADDDQVIIDGNGGALNNGGTVDDISGLFTFFGNAGTDELIVDDSGDGTGDAIDIVSTLPGEGTVGGAGSTAFGFQGLDKLTLYAGSGSDNISVMPNALTVIDIYGGAPALPATPGDSLTYLTPPLQTATFTPDGPDGGTIQSTGSFKDVDFDEIETLSFAGSLTVNGTAANDVLTITADGSNSGSYQLVSGGVAGPVVNFSNVTDFTFNGGDGDDTLVIDNSGITPTAGSDLFKPVNGITFNGQGNTGVGDKLEIKGGDASSVEHQFLNENDGYVFYDGETTATITYTGLEPILDTVAAADREFNYLGGAETITLKDDVDAPGGAVADHSQIDSDLGEIVFFLNPTNSLTIETADGTGADNINIEGVDGNFDANLIVEAGVDFAANDDDTVTFQTNTTDVGSGNVSVTAGSIALNAAVTTSGDVALDATNGSISGTSLVTAANARLEATVDVGAAGTEVELAVGGLEADVDGSLYVDNTGALSIGYVGGSLTGVSVGGASAIRSTGTLSVTENITASGSGLIHVESTTGNVEMDSGTQIDGDSGVVEVVASNNVELGLLTTLPAVSVTATTGAITDNNGGSNNISANQATLLAGTGAGAGAGGALETTITGLEANTGAGLYLDNTGYLIIGLSGGITGVTVGGPSRISSSNAISVNEDITASGGNLQLENTGGNFSLSTGVTISNTTYSVEVDSANDFYLSGTVQTTSGEISLRADNKLVLGSASVVTTTSGTSTATVTLSADDNHDNSGDFSQSEGSLVNAQAGTLNVTSYGDIRIADLRGATVVLDSAGGAIKDNTAAETALITATNAYLEAATDVGYFDGIDTAVTTLAGRSLNGAFQVSNSGALTIGTVTGYPAGVIATGLPVFGWINISASSPITVSNNVSGSGTVTLTTGDTPAATDDLTINAGVTVESTGADVVLTAGDDFLMDATSSIIADTTIDINIDPLAGDADVGTGGTLDLLGSVSATLTTLTGGDDNDTFNVLPSSTSPIEIVGGDPTFPTSPGDTLNLDFSNVTAPVLTLGGTAGSGTFSFVGGDTEEDLTFSSIEDVNTNGTGAYHLLLDMAAAGFEDATDDTVDVSMDSTGTDLQIAHNTNNIFTGDAVDILSFTVLGSSDNETVNINENNGHLPFFATAAPVGIGGSNGAHLNLAADTYLNAQYSGSYDVNDMTIHFDGGLGTDSVNMNFTSDHDAAYFADDDVMGERGRGNLISALAGVTTGIDLGVSFSRVEGVGASGAASGELRVDASSTPDTTGLNINDDANPTDGVSQIIGNGGFTTVLFDGFDALKVLSGTGAELIDMYGLDDNTSLKTVTLDADDVFVADDTANDVIRVRSTPAGVTSVNVLGGLGDDHVQLYDFFATVDNIFSTVNVDGQGGNDTLGITDYGDATGDTFTVTSTTVDGLTSAAATDVTYANIDDLVVIGTSGDDTINVNLTTQEDLNNVSLAGWDGNDGFNLQNSTPVGVSTNLFGNDDVDTFHFLGSNVLRGLIDGGADYDTIDYNSYTPPVHVQLTALGSIDGFQGDELNGSILSTVVGVRGFDNIDNLIGTTGVDTLEGPNLNNYWGITSTDAGFIIAERDDLAIGRPTQPADAIPTPSQERLNFTSFQNLIGGTQDDRFDLSDGAGLTGSLDGDTGNDSLDYRDYTTGVNVDLFAGTATNIAGGLAVGFILGDDDNSIENVFGGDGNDNITGDNDNNILGDGLGSDNLDGGGFGVGSGNGGNDVFLIEPGDLVGTSADVITDIHGNDTIDFRFASQGVVFDADILNTPQDVFGGNTVELRQIQVGDPQEQPDTNPSFMENVVGSEFDDLIFIDPLSQDGNYPIDGPPVLRSADGRGGTDTLDFDAKGQAVIDTGYSLTADGVGTVQYLNFENVKPFEDNPATIVDNGDLGFSLNGDWPYHPDGTAAITNGTGYQDDIHSMPQYAFNGHAESQAFWEFYGLTPGEYRVAVTWPVEADNIWAIAETATDSPFSVFDGSRYEIGTTALLRGSLDVNQQVTPDSFIADGVAWQDLGTFMVNSRTMTVMLSNLANGKIIADAVRIERVSAGPEVQLTDVTDTLAPPTVLVDGNPGGIDFGSTELLTDATRTFHITNSGSAPLDITNIVVPAGFTTTLAPQSIAAGDTIEFEITMGSNTFGDRTGLFSFDTNDLDEATFNLELHGIVSNVVIIDNGDVDFTATPGFETFADGINLGDWGYEGDIAAAVPNQPAFTPGPTGTDTATWNFTGLANGLYRVSSTWPALYNRSKDAPFTLTSGGNVFTIDVNQTLVPSSFVDDDTPWFDLNTSFMVTDNTLTVTLTNDADGALRDYFDLANGVIADAVRIEYLPTPDLEVTVDGNVVDDDTGVVDFGTTIPGVPVSKEFTITNLSADPVNVTGLIEFPPGFSIAPDSDFGTEPASFNLAGGASVTFTIQFDGGTTGTTYGQLSFTTGDPDENPYNFTVKGEAGPATVGIDDGGFSTSGSWDGYVPGRSLGDPTFLTAGELYGGGSGANTATWNFDVEPGRYQVVAHWYVHPDISPYGRGVATDAPYSLFVDGNPSPFATVRVNQQTSSDDFLDDGIFWEYIGDPVLVDGSSLTIQLSDDANGLVYADEVRIYRVVDPVIKVEVDGGTVEDSGSVNFEDTIVGAPVIKTFTVTNYGERNMALGPITTPPGFSLLAGFGNTNLAPGASTTFTLQMDAGTPGSFGGMVSFGGDLAEENPFNFTVSGSAADSMIVDDGELAFSTSGNLWQQQLWDVSDLEYYQGDRQYLEDSDHLGANTASWQFANLGTGTYQLSSHWMNRSNLATNAQITISGILGGPITISLNQRDYPQGFSDAGTIWQELGDFQVAAGNTLTVTISDDGADGDLVADAMRLELIPPGLTAPEIEVHAGAANLTSGVSSVDLGTVFYGQTVSQTFTVSNTGTNTLNLGAINLPPGFVISAAPGTPVLYAGHSTTFEVSYSSVGAPGPAGGLVSIANNDADEGPFEFNIAAAMTDVLIIDNGDAGYSSTANWSRQSADSRYHDDDTEYLEQGLSGTATWSFNNLTAGDYTVWGTWYSYPVPTATNAEFVVSGTPVVVNQQIAPDDLLATDGSDWEVLGTVSVGPGGSIIVSLSDNGPADGAVIADAIRIQRTGPLVAAAGVSSSSAPSITQSELDSVVDAAISYWEAAGLSDAQLSLLQSVSFVLSDLPDAMLGGSAGTTVLIDINAAGYGWFVDSTPFDSSEFSLLDGSLLAGEGSAAYGQMDLLTVVMHELGHTLGYGDLVAGQDLMSGSLDTSERRLPSEEDLDDFFSSMSGGDNPLLD